MKRLLITISALIVSACTLLNPQMCRYAEGPASVTIIADMTGGSAVAQVQEDGKYLSYPPDSTGKCPVPTPSPPTP